MTTTDFLTGTVKGPGELPHEYLFITKDNEKTRIGEFVYYAAKVGAQERQIIGTINFSGALNALFDWAKLIELNARKHTSSKDKFNFHIF